MQHVMGGTFAQQVGPWDVGEGVKGVDMQQVMEGTFAQQVCVLGMCVAGCGGVDMHGSWWVAFGSLACCLAASLLHAQYHLKFRSMLSALHAGYLPQH